MDVRKRERYLREIRSLFEEKKKELKKKKG